MGLEPSSEMRARARVTLADEAIELSGVEEFGRSECADLVYVNGVFHHVPHAEHAHELERIRSWLRPGALLALFENNPWNPGARLVMRRIPFDRDAVMVSPRRLAQRLRGAGFADVESRFYFIFPAVLRALRPLERSLERWPLGAQYAVYARAPGRVPEAGAGATR